MTASQMSYAITQQHQDNQSPFGFLSQMKKCSQQNDQALREAMNATDLVNIKMATMPQQLYARTRGHSSTGQPIEETSYNLQTDALNYRQKMPGMAEHELLVNQSLIYNSTTRNRVSENINRQKFLAQARNIPRGGTPNLTMPNQQQYWSDQPPQEMVVKTRHSNNAGLRNLLPQLPIGGFQVRRPRQSMNHSRNTMRAKSMKTRQSMTVQTDHETQDKTQGSETVQDQIDIDSQVQIDGRGSQIDPVRCLQKIFRKHERRERRPGVSLIAEKYKNEARSAKSRTGSRVIATANTFMTSGQFNLNSELNQAFSTRAGVDMPMTPVSHAPNVFGKTDAYLSFPTTPPNDAILLQHEESRIAPPATAPNGAPRPGYRAKTDLQATVSSALMKNSQAHQRQSTASDKVMPGSLSNANVTDSKLDDRKPYMSKFKRKTMPIMVEQTTQLDKPSNVASSNFGMSNQISSANEPKSQLLTANGSYEANQRNTAEEPLVSPNLGEALTMAQQAVRDKLYQMKQLFDQEEDDQNTDLQTRTKQYGLPQPESSEWDLHKHKLAYEKAMDKRHNQIEVEKEKQRTLGVLGETPLSVHDKYENHTVAKENKKKTPKAKPKQNLKLQSNLEMHEDELKDFLMQRIAELKNADDDKFDDLNSSKFKFRASTISNVLPSGNINEQSRLEANYKNRFRNKGEKLHQRMLNSQQRTIKNREGAQRKSHQRVLEAAKKDIVSNRSKETSPLSQSHTNTQSPSQPHMSRELLESESKDTVARQRKMRKNTRRHINTDLNHDISQPRESEPGNSTQKMSYNNASSMRMPLTPQGMMSYDKPISGVENPAIAINDCFSENGRDVQGEIGPGGVVIMQHKQVNDSPGRSTLEDPEQRSGPKPVDLINNIRFNAVTITSAEQKSMEKPPLFVDEREEHDYNTAIVFMVDEPEMTAGKKINYFTQVLRKIEMIDRSFAKEHKQRKMGLKQEALEIIQHAVESQKHASAFCTVTDGLITPVLEDLDFGCDEEDEVLSSDETDSQIGDVMNEFTATADQPEAIRKNAQRHSSSMERHPGGDTFQFSVAGEACEMVEHPNRARQMSKRKRHLSNQAPSRNSEAPIVQREPSRTLSQESVHSRVHTAEHIMTVEEDQEYYLNQQRMSDGAASIEQNRVVSQSKHKLVVMQHDVRGVDNNGEPIVVSQPRTASRQSQESHKAGSVEVVAHPKTSNKGDYTGLATISNTKFDGESIGQYNDQKQTFSVRLSAHGSIGMQNSTQRHISEYDGTQPISVGHPRSRTQTANISSYQMDKDMPTPRSMNMTHSLVTGSQLAYFCPKRFNRFPRFTIFFKKGLEKEEGSFVSENTVSLNADFLKFLCDKRSSAQSNGGARVHNQRIDEQDEGNESDKNTRSLKESSGRVSPNSHIMNAANPDIAGDVSRRQSGRGTGFRSSDIDKAEHAVSDYLGKGPIDVEQWNDYLKQKNFDPFDRVVLVKTIDNSILTSFRTLKGENNTVSDTFKIVHRKFQPQRTNNSFFKNIMTKHADKLLYQTQMIKPIDEISNDDDFEQSGVFQVYDENHLPTHIQNNDNYPIQRQQQQQTDTPDCALPSQPSIKANTRQNKIIVDPQKIKSFGRTQLNQSPLQHAMTTALFEIDNHGLSTPTAKGSSIVNQQIQQMSPGSARGMDKKSPFRVISQPSDKNIRDLAVNPVQVTQGSKRLPRPKPLNIAGTTSSKRKQSHTISPISNLTQQQQTSFGVTGISPLAQLNLMSSVYAKDPDQQNVEISDTQSPNDFRSLITSQNLASHQPTLERPNVQNVRTKPTGSNSKPVQNYASSALNTSQHNSTQNGDRGIVVESDRQIYKQATQTENEKRENKLQMEPNFQFNSTATVERRDELNKKPSSKTQQSGDAFAGGARTKSRNTETWTEDFVSGDKTNQESGAMKNKKGRNLNHKDNQPKSTLQLDGQKNTFLSSINKEQLLYEPQTDKLPPKIRDSQRDLVSSSNTQPVNQGQDGSLNVIEFGPESVPEFVRAEQLGTRLSSQFQATVQTATMSPPLVSVIRSNTQIVGITSADCLPPGGAGADQEAEDITVRAGAVIIPKSSHLESTQMVQDAVEMIVQSPIVHTALQGRKINKKIKVDNNKDLKLVVSDNNNASLNNWTSLGVGSVVSLSPREKKLATDRPRMQPPKPAEHVGVLQVPNSLKAQHTSTIFGVETVATSSVGAHKKGAVSSMIDKIYQRDRRMVNNMYKGNMLSTAVLTDLNRYHKLKSQTGVEATNYDEIWLQERIEEELREPGLSLDFAPGIQNLKSLESHQHSQLQAEQKSMHREHQMVDSPVPSPQMDTSQRKGMIFDNVEGVTTETKKKNLVEVPRMSAQNLIKKSLEGTLGDKTTNKNTTGSIVGETVNYSEMVNRSELRTHLGQANYN